METAKTGTADDSGLPGMSPDAFSASPNRDTLPFLRFPSRSISPFRSFLEKAQNG